MTAKPEIRSEADAFRAAFHDRMHANNMFGLWELASQMTPHPQPKMIPHMWPWSVTESIVEESARAVPVGDERRALHVGERRRQFDDEEIVVAPEVQRCRQRGAHGA